MERRNAHIIDCQSVVQRSVILRHSPVNVPTRHSGVARNLSRGEQIRGVWGTDVPQRGPGADPRWGLADEFTTKMFRILIAR